MQQTLTPHDYDFKRNFGLGKNPLANLLASLNLFAFALHAVLDCISDLSRQGRAQAETRRRFFVTLGFRPIPRIAVASADLLRHPC